MKRLLLATILMFSSYVASADKFTDDLKDCTMDAVNFTMLATVVITFDEKSDWDKFIEKQMNNMHSKEAKEWVLSASDIAWTHKGKMTPTAQGMMLYETCVNGMNFKQT